MLFGFKDATDVNRGSEKESLLREADEAFHADDKTSCVDTIDRLYELLDEMFVNPGRGRRPFSTLSRK